MSALDQITATEREAVELRVVDELGYSEIALRLGRSEARRERASTTGLARLAALMEGLHE
jgi:DNA-directed RNA polymerase specialized sigma24 family protein